MVKMISVRAAFLELLFDNKFSNAISCCVLQYTAIQGLFQWYRCRTSAPEGAEPSLPKHLSIYPSGMCACEVCSVQNGLFEMPYKHYCTETSYV